MIDKFYVSKTCFVCVTRDIGVSYAEKHPDWSTNFCQVICEAYHESLLSEIERSSDGKSHKLIVLQDFYDNASHTFLFAYLNWRDGLDLPKDEKAIRIYDRRLQESYATKNPTS